MFVTQTAREVRQRAGNAPKSYAARFYDKFKDEVVLLVKEETQRAERTLAEVKAGEDPMNARLNARLHAAREAGDEEEVDAVWQEAADAEAAGQAKVDAVSAGLDQLNLRLDACTRLAPALDVNWDTPDDPGSVT